MDKMKILSLFFLLFLHINAEIVKICIWKNYSYLNDTIIALYNTYNKNPGNQIQFIIPDSDFNAIERVTSTNCDISMVDPIWTISHSSNMVPLTIDSEIEERINSENGIYKDLLEDVTIYDEKKKKEVFGLPFLLDFSVLYYNTNKTTTAPTTYDDLINISKDLKVDSTFGRTAKYACHFNDWRGYYYNYVEAISNFSNNDNFTLYGKEAGEAMKTFFKLFSDEIFNEKEWNSDADLLKEGFMRGEIVYMKNWASYENLIKDSGIGYSISRNLKSGNKPDESRSIARGVFLTILKRENSKPIELLTSVIKDLTSKEFLKSLTNEIVFKSVPPYLDIFNDALKTEYCTRVNCDLYSSIINNIVVKPIARFTRNDGVTNTHFSAIFSDSYDNCAKETYKSRKGFNDDTLDKLSNYFENKYINWTDMTAIIIGGVSVIGIIVTLVVFIITIKNRGALVIRRSSPLFLYFMLIGILIAFGSVFTYIGEPNEIICAIRPTVIVLAFGFSFLALFVKTFRIKVIFDKSDIKVQDKYLLIYSGSILLLELIIVGLWTYLDRMKPIIKYINPKMHYYTCSNVGNLGSYFQYALLIINAIILLYGCYLAIKVRNVYSDYNESKVIGLSIYGIMICMIIQLIISAVASLGHSVIFIIQSLMIILSSVILLTFMFIPKFWKLHMTGSSQNPNSQPSSRPSNNQNNNINNTNSYSTKSEKNGYINMQNVENDYYNNMAQRNNHYNNSMNGSSEALNNYNNSFNNNYSGYNSFNNNYYNNSNSNSNSYAYRSNVTPEAYVQYNY